MPNAAAIPPSCTNSRHVTGDSSKIDKKNKSSIGRK